MTNRHVDVRLRMKFFDSVVTPAVLYGLTPAPLTQKDCSRLGITQRKMLRLIIGYTKHSDDTWADMYRRLKLRINAATQQTPIQNWETALSQRVHKLHDELQNDKRNRLSQRVFAWNPVDTHDPKLSHKPHRQRGRPSTSWVDENRTYAANLLISHCFAPRAHEMGRPCARS